MPAVFELIAAEAGVAAAEMWSVFNMGCGFCVVVPEAAAAEAVAVLDARHPGTARIGTVTDEPGAVGVPGLGVRIG